MVIKALSGPAGLLLAGLLSAALAGCGGTSVFKPTPEAAFLTPFAGGNSDQARLKNALLGAQMTPSEVVDLSDRLLAGGNPALRDQETMARLELLLLKTLNSPDKSRRAPLWRNLGILHYHQQKYKLARQELQTSNEINPRNARTHFYLARLFAHEGQIYERQGKNGKGRQQFKRAAIEMEQARKIEPGNPLFRQDIRQIISRE